MKILTLNIRQGGGNRKTKIIEAVKNHHPDILIFTEFRENGNSGYFRNQLSELGYLSNASASIRCGLNTVFIASKDPFVSRCFYETLWDDGHRILVTEFKEVTVAGVYFAQKNQKKKLFDFLNQKGRTILGNQGIIMGDFNTGKHLLDEKGATFSCADEFNALESNGLVDAWRSRNKKSKEYSWYSHAGNGFRIDHAFVSSELNRKVEKIYYSHTERNVGVSDHSALILELR